VEFLINDVAAATQELRAAGVPVVSGPVYWEGEDDVAWVHFRAPDGNIYGLTQGRDLEPGPEPWLAAEPGDLWMQAPAPPDSG
jgi:hypothetical protein